MTHTATSTPDEQPDPQPKAVLPRDRARTSETKVSEVSQAPIEKGEVRGRQFTMIPDPLRERRNATTVRSCARRPAGAATRKKDVPEINDEPYSPGGAGGA